jgi:dihydroneopterin aldolase
MKKNNLNIVKIDKNKTLFNYEKKILIKELILDLKLGYYDFEKEKSQKLSLILKLIMKIRNQQVMMILNQL